MGLIGIGFLIGAIITLAMIGLLMSGKEEKPVARKPIEKEDMINVISFFLHFGRPTPYEREVLQAVIDFIERNEK